MALGSVIGPVLGGWLVSADIFGWGWRMIFAINIPIGITALILGARFLPSSHRDRTVGVDAGGAILACAALVAVTFALVEGRDYGWPWWCIALLLVGAAAVAAFVVHQRRRGRRGQPTLIAPSLLRNRVFVGGVVTGLFFFAAFMGSGLVLAVVLQIGLGMSPLGASVTMLPQALGVLIGFILSQRLGMRCRTMIAGVILAAGGQLLLATILTWQGASLAAWWLLPALLSMGVGFGMAMGPFFDLVISGVDETATGSASGILSALQQVGGAVGIALVGTIFFTLADHAGDPGPGALTAAAARSFLAAAGLAAVATALIRWVIPAHRQDAREAAGSG